MPWKTTENNIRSGHQSPEEFQKDTLKTITFDEKEGVKAVIGKLKGKDAMEIQSYLFEKDKGWTLEKAKEWFKKHHTKAKKHVYAVLPFTIIEKMLEKPLRIYALANAIIEETLKDPENQHLNQNPKTINKKSA